MKRPARRASPPGTPRTVAYLHDNIEFGGIETLQLQLLRHLDPQRYRGVVVVVEYAPTSSPRFREQLDALGVPLLAPDPPAGPQRLHGIQRVWSLQRLLRRERIDVVHIQTRTPQSSRRLTCGAVLGGSPAIIRTEHVSPGPHVGRWTRQAVIPFDLVTDLVITDSQADRREQIELVGRSPAKVATSYCGIDPFAFDPHHDVAAAKAALGLHPDVAIVGSVARMHEQKGHRYLVEAAARVVDGSDRPVEFLLVGDGPEEGALRDQVRALGLEQRVHFAGFQADAVPYMHAMDVVAMPSLWEGFSISMQEFMALGKPMVVSDHHSFREAMVDGEHAIIVPMRDGAALAEGILRLLRDPELAAKIGTAASERVRSEFSIERHAADLMAFYDTVLDERT